MVRLFHFSDTHLGHQQYPRTDSQGLNQREQDLYRAFEAVIDAAVEAKPDVVLHAGDLFDGVRPSNRALAAAMEGFLRLSRAGIPTVIIAGNHEHPKIRETGSPFRLFEHLAHVYPVYKGHAESIALATPTGPLTIHAVPQCIDGDALAREMETLDRSSGGHHVLMLHGAVHNLDAFRNAEFNELTLDTRWFNGFSYVALGHYHGCHEVTPRAWYCGAPERVSMAEAGEEKGFLDVHLDDGMSVTFRTLAGRRYMDLPRLDAQGMDASQVFAAAKAALGRVPEGAVARLRIYGLDPNLRGVLDVRGLQAEARHALHLDLRLAWSDDDLAVRGSVELAGLMDEFEAFAASQPIEHQDRAVLLAMAREVLAEAVAT